MGIYSCENKTTFYPMIYIMIIIILLIVGGLFEGGILQKKHNSVGWYGVIGLIVALFLLVMSNAVFNKFGDKFTSLFKTYYWYFSHILCYFLLTFVSPDQWPFWLAIGIAWELFECYYSCRLNEQFAKKWISCSGMYDITANLAGIAIAMWIRSEIPVSV